MRSLRRCGTLAAVCLVTAAVPRTTVAQVTVVETLRIGGPDEGPYLFSDIRGLAPGSNGSVLVLDYKAQEIRLFDNQGRFVKRVARRGSGPGEIADANGLLVAPNGEIWVNDPENSRWSVFSPNGDFVRQHILPINSYAYVWAAMIDAAGVIHDPVFVPSADGRRSVVVENVQLDGNGRSHGEQHGDLCPKSEILCALPEIKRDGRLATSGFARIHQRDRVLDLESAQHRRHRRRREHLEIKKPIGAPIDVLVLTQVLLLHPVP